MAKVKAETKPKAKGRAGRIGRYTTALAERICEMIATTSLATKEICKLNGIDYATVKRWIAKENHPFCALYARAKEQQYELLAEEIITISDDGSNDYMTIVIGEGLEIQKENKELVNRSRLRVESRKWLLAKLKPKVYGDKVDLNHGGQTDNPIGLVISKETIKAISKQLEDEV